MWGMNRKRQQVWETTRACQSPEVKKAITTDKLKIAIPTSETKNCTNSGRAIGRRLTK